MGRAPLPFSLFSSTVVCAEAIIVGALPYRPVIIIRRGFWSWVVAGRGVVTGIVLGFGRLWSLVGVDVTPAGRIAVQHRYAAVDEGLAIQQQRSRREAPAW